MNNKAINKIKMFLPLSIMLLGASHASNQENMNQNIGEQMHRLREELAQLTQENLELTQEISKLTQEKLQLELEKQGLEFELKRKKSEELESEELKITFNRKQSKMDQAFDENSKLFDFFEEIKKITIDTDIDTDIESITNLFSENDRIQSTICYIYNGLLFYQLVKLKKSLPNNETEQSSWKDYILVEKEQINGSNLGELKKQSEFYDYVDHMTDILNVHNKRQSELLNQLINIYEKNLKNKLPSINNLKDQLASSFLGCFDYTEPAKLVKVTELAELVETALTRLPKIRESIKAEEIPEESEAAATIPEGEISI